MTRRLYLKLYLTFLGVAALALVSAGMAAHHFREGGPPFRYLGPLARAVLHDEPHRPSDMHAIHARMRDLAEELSLDVAVWDQTGRPLVQASRGPFPPPPLLRHGWHRGGIFVIPLEGGRFLGVREGFRNRARTITRVGKTVRGNPNIGKCFVHTVIDDHSRVAFVQALEDDQGDRY